MNSRSSWLVVLKPDEPRTPWGECVKAGETWHIDPETTRPARGWPTFQPSLIVVRAPARGPLQSPIAIPTWKDSARVWCHFGNNESDDPSLHAGRIAELWADRSGKLFSHCWATLVNSFSSSSLKTQWDQALMELAKAFRVAQQNSSALEFDLDELDNAWDEATRRYHVDLVHLKFLEVIFPAYLAMTFEANPGRQRLITSVEEFVNGPYGAHLRPRLAPLSEANDHAAVLGIVESLFASD